MAGAQGGVADGQAGHAWDEGGQELLLRAQLGQDDLVAGLLLLVEVEQAHAQTCRQYKRPQ
jgi:hypothetical protein